MRQWIAGFLLGIGRWIGRLAWPLLLIWMLSNVAQCSLVASIPQPRQVPSSAPATDPISSLAAALQAPITKDERPALGVTAAISRGYAGAFWSNGRTAAAISANPTPLVELDIRGIDIDVRRWLPHARRTDVKYVWPLALSTTRSSAQVFAHAPATIPPVLFSVLLATGVCFALRLVLSRTSSVPGAFGRALRQWGARTMFALAAVFVLWPSIELGRFAGGGACIARVSGSASFENRGIRFNITGFSAAFETTAFSRHFYIARQYGGETRIPIDICATAVQFADAPGVDELAPLWFMPTAVLSPTPSARVPGLLVVVAFVCTGYLLQRGARHARSGSACRRCKYDLTGNTSGVCPECGTPVVRPTAATRTSSDRQTPHRFGAAAWRVVAVAAIALLLADLAYIMSIGSSRFSQSDASGTFVSASTNWSVFAIVWLTIGGTLLCSLARRSEPPGYLRYRLLVVANLLALIAVNWPVV